MKCPFCGSDDTQVKDSRPSDDGRVIRRRRECTECGRRFTTFERFQVQQVIVLKRNNQRELFDRDKLTKSILTALRKRPVSQNMVAQVVSDIEQQLTESGKSEVTSQEVGTAVLNALKDVDFVGYIRYASVYNDFSSPEDFGRFVEDAK
ncbi:MAG: transcriptional regulator NrdR [Alphaproteobacteria bacterium]|nr:transcriptional regulator NrdR [Alphaproteobacteria bacterium]MDD9920444.1 transcriptional regulator NrdR [Alphaproteobacteria bacterium]